MTNGKFKVVIVCIALSNLKTYLKL